MFVVSWDSWTVSSVNIIPDFVLDSNLSGTSQMFLAEQDIPHAAQYSFTQQTIVLHPEPQLDGVKGRQSNIFIVDVETGVYNSIVITNNVTEPVTNLIDDSQVIN